MLSYNLSFVPVSPGKTPPEKRGNEGQKLRVNFVLLSPKVVYHSKRFLGA